MTLLLLIFNLFGPAAFAEEPTAPPTPPTAASHSGPEPASDPNEHEPIPYFERYQPSFFLIGEPNTKVQLSFKVQAFRDIPIYLGYTQLMIWDLFKESAPVREMNYSPEFFYRFDFESSHPTYVDFGAYQHESNGIGANDSRSWNRTYLRIFQTRTEGLGSLDRRVAWSLKVWLPWAMNENQPSRDLPRYRGIWEAQFAISDLFERLFEVNELILRIYPGGSKYVNPLHGGQELTYREKRSSRKFLLPFYIQIFHGYGENLLDANDERWGFRAGIGF